MPTNLGQRCHTYCVIELAAIKELLQQDEDDHPRPVHRPLKFPLTASELRIHLSAGLSERNISLKSARHT
jgi:hypothetical protein